MSKPANINDFLSNSLRETLVLTVLNTPATDKQVNGAWT